MKINKVTLKSKRYPQSLRQIASPPQQLYWSGMNPASLMKRRRVAIVGSRQIASYGQEVTQRLASELAGQGIVVISGLAFGVDALAHRTVLQAKGLTAAILPGPLDDIVPATHQYLAQKILESGGTLLTEYSSGERTYKTNFVARNRLVAGLADAVLITEATASSGSLHTARFAREQGKPVLVVPGNITSPLSAGTNELLKTGALVVTSFTDVLGALGLTVHRQAVDHLHGKTPEEQVILDLLLKGVTETEILLKESKLAISRFNQTLGSLEISGMIKSLGNNQWGLV